MRNAIILHGMPNPGHQEYYNPDFPSASNSHWIPWLQKQLVTKDISTQTPEMPNAWKPDYATWKKEFERYDTTPATILVGHSCGGGFLVRWLSEHPGVQVNNVILVAPWLDPRRDNTTDFFEFTIDPNLANRCIKLMIFASDDDFETIQMSVHNIRENIKNIKYREFHNYGHFTLEDIGTVEFPELLDEAIT